MPCWPSEARDLPHMLLFASVDDWIDDEGRPIGEIRASKAVREATTARYARCPYAGSRGRQPRLINVSALDQTLAHWPSVLAILAFAREAAGLHPCEPARLLDLARVAAFVQILPAYCGFANPALEALPAVYSAAHKMAAGLFGLIKNRLIAIAMTGCDSAASSDTARDLHRFAERSGALLSRTGIEACAGPPSHIAAALRLLTGDDHVPPVHYGDIPLLPDASRFALYANSVLGLHLWLGAFIAECRMTDAVPSDAPYDALPAVHALLALPAEALMGYGRGCSLLLAMLHPDQDSVAKWQGYWEVTGTRKPGHAPGLAVFEALQAMVHSAFEAPLGGLYVSNRHLRRWCALSSPAGVQLLTNQ